MTSPTGHSEGERDQPHQRAPARDERHGAPGQRVLRDLAGAEPGRHQPGQHPQAGAQAVPEQVHPAAEVFHRQQGKQILILVVGSAVAE